MPVKINKTTAPATVNSARTGINGSMAAPMRTAPYAIRGTIVYHIQSSGSGLYAVTRLVRVITRTTYTTPYRPQSPTRKAASISICHGAFRTAETNNAAPKCVTVGVLYVATPSMRWELSIWGVSIRVTSVMTTNISPTSAAADEPVMT